MLKHMLSLFVMALLVVAPGSLAAKCPTGISRFALTGVSRPACLAQEAAVMWGRLFVESKPPNSYCGECPYTLYSNAVSGYNADTAAVSPDQPPPAFPWLSTPAPVTYPTRGGGSATWKATEYDFPRSPDSCSDNGKFPSDWKGFSGLLSYMLPVRTTESVVVTPSRVTAKQLPDGASFQITQAVPIACTFTYTIYKGAFAGMKPSRPPTKQPSCSKGMVPLPTETGGSVCAFCPAGTVPSGGSCKPCADGRVSVQAGATACQACASPLVAGPLHLSCVPGYMMGAVSKYDTPTAIHSTWDAPLLNAATRAGLKAVPCADGTMLSLNNVCLGTAKGGMCAPGACAAPPRTQPLGGAVLELAGSDLSSQACKQGGMPELAAFLRSRRTFMGFNVSKTPKAYASWGPLAYGLNWAVAGSVAGSPLTNGVNNCGGDALGSGIATPRALTITAAPLDTTAYLFGAVLDGRQGSSDTSWGAIASKGSAPGTVVTRWFQNNALLKCGPTPRSPPAPPGTCTLTFRVVGGSVLGATAASAQATCPPGSAAGGSASGGAPACLMCYPGTRLGSKGTCQPCEGKTYQDEWGAVACKPCANPSPEKTACAGN